ncbi:MAG TPA: amino acid racemase [Candidatus Binatia bacterium]|nr:amino acid racemase [Candidatus Binatia bacterium]
MKLLGIIGGLGPESTVDYYRQIIASWRRQTGDRGYPAIVITSLDVDKGLRLVGAQAYAELADYLVEEVERLARAGADFGLISANTPHLVFDEVQRRSPIPLISIVEAACAAAKRQGMAKVGLLGTRFTMQARFYPDVFSREGILLVTPSEDEQLYIHDKYVHELIPGIFLDTTRGKLQQIVHRMWVEKQIQGVLLAGTELPLILRRQEVPDIPLLDTTEIHVEAAVARLLS